MNNQIGFWRRLERSIRKRRKKLASIFTRNGWAQRANVTSVQASPPESRIGPPRKLLNHDLQAMQLGLRTSVSRVRTVAVGIVTFNQTEREVEQVIATARQALSSNLCEARSRILILDNGNSTSRTTHASGQVAYLPSRGNIGFGAAHNILMAEAFKSEADLYIAANPDGRFHRGAIEELVRMSSVHENRALIEAIQFPEEHPKEFDPETFDTPWASGACLVVPKMVYDSIGGFDEAFFMYCEDVDLSWRARAAGFGTKICPRALFFHPVTNRAANRERKHRLLTSGLIFARKWRSHSFEKLILRELRAARFEIPEIQVSPVPESWTRVCDFSHRFSFAPTRW